MFEFIFVPHVIFVRLFIPFFRYFSVLIQSTSRSQFFFVVYFYGSHPPYLHLATSEMWFWSGGRGILRKLSLLYSTVCYYNGAQRYEQFLYKSVDCIGLLSCLVWLCIIWAPLYLRSSWCYINSIFCLHPSLYLSVSWAWWDWPLTWLTKHRPSVLWHCWLGHVTHKIVSEMTYNVSNVTLNLTIYHTYLELAWDDNTTEYSPMQIATTKIQWMIVSARECLRYLSLFSRNTSRGASGATGFINTHNTHCFTILTSTSK